MLFAADPSFRCCEWRLTWLPSVSEGSLLQGRRDFRACGRLWRICKLHSAICCTPLTSKRNSLDNSDIKVSLCELAAEWTRTRLTRAGTTILLTTLMSYRFYRSQKFMPAGMIMASLLYKRRQPRVRADINTGPFADHALSLRHHGGMRPSKIRQRLSRYTTNFSFSGSRIIATMHNDKQRGSQHNHLSHQVNQIRKRVLFGRLLSLLWPICVLLIWLLLLWGLRGERVSLR